VPESAEMAGAKAQVKIVDVSAVTGNAQYSAHAAHTPTLSCGPSPAPGRCVSRLMGNGAFPMSLSPLADVRYQQMAMFLLLLHGLYSSHLNTSYF
jgi:hypothetical protein